MTNKAIKKVTIMNYNIYFTLTVLSGILLNANSKKCCDKDCSSKIFNSYLNIRVNLLIMSFFYNILTHFSLFYTAAISMGRAITTFQDHYPGFLTYLSGDKVTVLSKDQIQGIEFWEAEVGHVLSYYTALIFIYSFLCVFSC